MSWTIRPNVFWHAVLGAVVLFFVGWMDYVSVGQLNFSVLYYLPIALWAWHIGLGPAIFMACVSTCGFTINDYLNGNTYPDLFFRVCNAGIHGAAFIAVAICIHLLHKRFLRERELNFRLAKTVGELDKSMTEVRKLRQQALTICPVTGRIKIGGEWIHIENFLRENLEMAVQEEVSGEVVSGMAEKMIEYYGWRE